MSARAAVLVSGGGTNLQALIDAARRGEMPDCRLSLVVSNVSGAYALQRAGQAGIPCQTCVRDRKEDHAAFETRLLRILREYSIDMLILAGFMTILSADFVRQFPDRIINVHPSLIPSFCGKGFYGLRVHEAALAYGVKVTGATVHLVNEIPDGGHILLQKAVPVHPDDTPQTLQRRVMEQAEWVLLPQAAQMIAKEMAQ